MTDYYGYNDQKNAHLDNLDSVMAEVDAVLGMPKPPSVDCLLEDSEVNSEPSVSLSDTSAFVAAKQVGSNKKLRDFTELQRLFNTRSTLV